MVLKEPTEQLLPDLITTTTAVSEKKKNMFFVGAPLKWKITKMKKKIQMLIHMYFCVRVQK